MVHPTPGTAFAVVVWRNPNGSPPSDAGVYDFVLWKQGGRWLAFALRTAYLHPILASDPPKGGWVIEDGALASVAGKGVASLVSEEEFLEFELEWEWKAAKGANSGVSYQLFGVNFWDVTGMEYQVVDDNGDPGTIKDNKQKSGAVYCTTSVSRSFARPLGKWNQSRIRLHNNRTEHWLNGEKVAEYVVDGIFPSPIALQFHGPGVWFRNMRIRPISQN